MSTALERLDEALDDVDEIYSYIKGDYFDEKWGLGEKAERVKGLLRAYRDLLANGEREWHCEYPEFNDPDCQSGMGNPQPDKTRQPRKHTQCRWVYLVDIEGEER